MGTPEFAVPILESLYQCHHRVVGVVTVPDKPAGRGRKLHSSAVKECALALKLPIAQPVSLRDPAFLEMLRQWNPDLIVVVAFRMLPKEVYAFPPLGSINLHASLLPLYRGAAPIQRAIMNGERVTGLTTFILDEKTDTGALLLQESMDIGADETAGELHDRMMICGANLVLKTVDLIAQGNIMALPQVTSPGDVLPVAPKILKSDCQIRWNDPAWQVYNHIRGLSPVPAAFTFLTHPIQGDMVLKIYRSALLPLESSPSKPCTLASDGKTCMKINLTDGVISLLEVQLQGKKRMRTEEFLRGFPILDGWELKLNG